jgi:hypothetical protein
MDVQALIAGGFVPVRYDGQEGEFLTRHSKVHDLPYAREHLVDGDYIDAEMSCCTEIIPPDANGVVRVQFSISEADYMEGPWEISTDEGQALLKDALAASRG